MMKEHKGPFRKTSVAEKYVAENPHLSTYALAKLIQGKHPKVWADAESARLTVRYLRGEKGESHRATRAKLGIYDNSKKIDINKLPKSYVDGAPSRPYVIPKERDRALVISDLHIPYHDIKAVELALNYGLENKANVVIINGDLLDFHNASRFEKNPEKRDVHEELQAARQFLRYLRELFPDALILFAEGNHDARYPRLIAKIPELMRDPELTLRHRLGLDDLGIEFIPSNRYIKFRKLPIVHGHQFYGGSNAVNAARGAFMKSLESVLVSHHHQASTHPNTTAFSKKLMIANSTGCLCDLSPEYAPFSNRSMHGFVFLWGLEDGWYYCENKWIYKGRIIGVDEQKKAKQN